MSRAARTGGGRRLLGLLRKEWLQVLRDPSSIAIAFLLPAALLLLFGYGVSLDSKHVPIGIVIEQPGAEAASFAAAFGHSDYFAPRLYHTRQAARAALRAHELDGFVVVPADFVHRLKGERAAPVQVVVNGVNANSGRLLTAYVRGVWSTWLASELRARQIPIVEPVAAETRIWFNPEVRSRNYLVPGLLVVNMTLVGALLTALVFAREWERGTLEALMVTPVTLREILLGKLLPYFALGIGGMALSVVMALYLFEVPLRGSLWVLVACSTLFLAAALGMGLLISIVTRSQFVAGMVALIATFLPAFLLSGFLFDIDSMPTVVQVITHLIAARYFVTILQTLFLAGDVWSVILPNAAALVLMAAFFLGLSRRLLRKRIE
ncbi:ABC-type multidrug transport system, permease component [Thioflavicoccus mobilis 8321]|uniref:ABC-type multidrug transport system, permease component n=1 Tax=Thioflavicoccus mobilis 8321 TaxID=765912 RepID=L0GWV2_9GAMM|nr:ABC transporter permease [Thioflavicoccus mobilis]AGA90451.1 ABC-type multidrug transport system, permease component [Thioflavicoccus mobilis 8321]